MSMTLTLTDETRNVERITRFKIESAADIDNVRGRKATRAEFVVPPEPQ